jgi:putative copper export protein
MVVYRVVVVLHVLAMSLWLGHMLVWSLGIGPALKRIEPAETAAHLRERSVYLGGLGWPALAVLAVTGIYLLTWRGVGLLEALAGAAGWPIQVKLLAVAGMVAYQALYGHRPAPLAIYVDIALALVVLACSVLLVRGVG